MEPIRTSNGQSIATNTPFSSPKDVTKFGSHHAGKGRIPNSSDGGPSLPPRNLTPLFQSIAGVTEDKAISAFKPCANEELIAVLTADKREPKEKTAESSQDNNHSHDSDCDSVGSLYATRGKWEGDDEVVPFHGCVCGQIHGRPIPVFWVQCEGPCQAWYNVTPACVQGMTHQDAVHAVWNCPPCNEYFRKHPALQMLLTELPSDVLFRILEFIAKPTHRAAVLQDKIAPLCRASHQFVRKKNQGIWELILQRDYYSHQQTIGKATHSTTPTKHDNRKRARENTPVRASKRQRKSTNFLTPDDWGSSSGRQSQHFRQMVIKEHLQLLCRTEDAYMAIEALADPLNGHQVLLSHKIHKSRQLSLQRIRRIVQSNQPLDLNRPSPASGRTFLQVCCAAEVNEAIIVRCCQYLIKHGADPNVCSIKEEPFANRPALYFAISRAMPRLVEILIQAGASLTHQATGLFRRTFDPSRSISGTFTPLEFGRELKRTEVDRGNQHEGGGKGGSEEESSSTSAAIVPPYWVSKVNTCIRVLAEATERCQRNSS